MHTESPARRALGALAALALVSSASAQQAGAAFQTPGMPRYGVYVTGQADRFTKDFNPAIGAVIDMVGSWIDIDDTGENGFDLTMRTLEVTGQAYLDPKAWAYFVAALEDDLLAVEEAAINYIGLPNRSTIKAGRFFVDFGKQMQVHEHDLRTVDRPLVLREYLGEELAGDGVQWDHWLPVGDGAVRWSIGAFGSLLADRHGDEATGTEPELGSPALKDVDELSYSARLTGFMDAGTNGVLQMGTSLRAIPEFTAELESSGDLVGGLSNQVLGLDVTYGWTDDEGVRNWTTGGEFLFNGGDNGAAVDDAGTPLDPTDDSLVVFDQTVGGFYAFLDHGWTTNDSAGLQYSLIELADGADSKVQEVDLYYTKLFSEFHRLRFAVTHQDHDVDGDSVRLTVQYTGFIGAHAHGINW